MLGNPRIFTQLKALYPHSQPGRRIRVIHAVDNRFPQITSLPGG